MTSPTPATQSVSPRTQRHRGGLRLLVVDVGNSSTSMGLYVNGRVLQRKRIPTVSLKTASRESNALIRALVGDQGVHGASVASVVPAMNEAVCSLIRAGAGVDALMIRHGLKLGAPVSYPDPESLGADRLANLSGAVSRYRAPLIVVDVGTATTFDVIQSRKGYTGGVIAPGPDLMLSYLAEKTALLPALDLMPVRAAIGRSTEDAMRLGALHGYRGMVKGVIAHLKRRMRNKRITLCATGGYARWVLKGMELPFVYDKDLTLYGVGRIYELNV